MAPMTSELVRDALLHADRLYRFYRAGDEETLALCGVSLTLEPGQTVAVTGPSGSGKSTLLRCLAGLDEPSGGTVWVAGERMSHRRDPVRARLRARHVGILSQGGNLFEQLTVLDNVRLVQRLAGAAGGPGRPEPAALLARLGLERRAHAMPTELSGGEAARGSLAVALANKPVILIADEPTGELDESTEARVLDLVAEHADGGGGVLLASHSEAVRRRADRVIVLSDGRVAGAAGDATGAGTDAVA
jgi:putative ABC transport system ATP-binding protein